MPHRPGTLASHRQAIQQVVTVMRRDPSAPLDLESMAATVSMSRYHFLRVFEEVTQVSPARFLAALRMERAKRLLIETSISVTTVCFEVGYSSLGTFSRLFIECVGVSPKSFRMMAGQMVGQSIDDLVAKYVQRRLSRLGAVISGSVQVPPQFSGVIFVGLFPSPIPQRRPINGSLLMHQGRFDLSVGDVGNTCYLLAAGFPISSNLKAYLVPSQEELLVSSCSVLGKVGGEPNQSHNLQLRPLETFDPPILIALPLLLST